MYASDLCKPSVIDSVRASVGLETHVTGESTGYKRESCVAIVLRMGNSGAGRQPDLESEKKGAWMVAIHHTLAPSNLVSHTKTPQDDQANG
jgi:hypothetical protein